MTVSALSPTRFGNNFHRVRSPALRLVDQLLNECRDVEAQALLTLLESHMQQRVAITDYHNRLLAALHRQAA